MNFKMNAMAFILICIYAVICFSSIFLATATENNILLARISRGNYSQHAVHFYMDEESWSYEKMIKQLQKSEMRDFSLIYDDYEKNLRQIYLQGKVDPPPMVSGRYFTTDDFCNHKALAVIGLNRKNDVIKKNGKLWIEVEDKWFEVIGIMGYRVETLLDDTIIVNADALLRKGSNNIFILDAYSGIGKGSSENMFNKLNELACKTVNAGNPPLKRLDADPIGTDRLFYNLINDAILFMLLIFCYVMCSISISYEWISKQRRRIAVMRLIGWTDWKLRRVIYSSYFKLALLGVGFGILLAMLFNIKVDNEGWLAAIAIVNIIIGWLITVPAVKQMLAITVTEVMR